MVRVTFSPGRIGPRPFGVGIHAVELLGALAALAPGRAEITYQWWGRSGSVDPIALFPAPPRPQFRRTPLPTRAYRQLHHAPRILRNPLVGSFDVFHQVGTSLNPPAASEALVVSLHDAVGARWAESEVGRSAGAGALLARARRVVTVSEFSRQEIQETYGLPADQVQVIPNGCDLERFRPGRGLPADLATRIQGRPFVLMVGGATKRKNVARGLQAFAEARRASGDDLLLVLAGQAASSDPSAVSDLVRARAAIDLGYRTRDELASLLANAALLLFPSLYEGFGLPILEAFASGCPVVGHNGSAVAEVSGGHASLVDARHPAELAAMIVSVIGWTDERRREWSSRALGRAREFTWERAALAHLDLYQAVADSRPPARARREPGSPHVTVPASAHHPAPDSGREALDKRSQ